MTHTYAQTQVQRSVGSSDRVKTNRLTDRRTLPIALPSQLMRSVIMPKVRHPCICYLESKKSVGIKIWNLFVINAFGLVFESVVVRLEWVDSRVDSLNRTLSCSGGLRGQRSHASPTWPQHAKKWCPPQPLHRTRPHGEGYWRNQCTEPPDLEHNQYKMNNIY